MVFVLLVVLLVFSQVGAIMGKIKFGMRLQTGMIQLLLTLIYISFISLGLPDGILGAAWPTMHQDLGVPVSYAGIISMIIAAGTIVSSLLSDRLTRRFGAGKVTSFSVAMTAISLIGYALTRSYLMLCLLSVPYGLGAGCVDAALNNYVALHFASRHMSWLHCAWGAGAAVGPYVMGMVLTCGGKWPDGYLYIGVMQVVLTAVLLFSLPVWNRQTGMEEQPVTQEKGSGLMQAVKLPGAKEIMIAFFCYCALEQTAALWASSYLNVYKGVSPEIAAFFGSMFFVGMTVGRVFNGFLTYKFTDPQLIRAGFGFILAGVLAMLLPLGQIPALVGFVLIGIGCAPVYPCIIHSTPGNFGAENSQVMIGIQMASAYVGILVAPTVFGVLARHISMALMPPFLLVILALMWVMYERTVKKTAKKHSV